ncbi:MAG TPA: hypothetical protein VOB72_12535 [Candidatus Dormibacteraeota bacterium]|nr:hypothetical protein [Candidatus Dormibacteraeota bacterium]
MRGFFIGIFLMFFVVVSVLSIRPGGLRYQLRQAVRRLKLALTLAGIYLVASTVLRLAFPDNEIAEIGMVVLGGALCITFLVMSGDQPASPTRSRTERRS